MNSYISGIQQCGIGVSDAAEAALYYKELLGFDCLVFDDVAEAGLMQKYTGNRVHKRRALLTMNMQGGGGLELWQFIDRSPAAAPEKAKRGDLGIFAIKIKTRNIEEAYKFFINRNKEVLSKIYNNIAGKKCFLLEDIYKNHFEIIEAGEFFSTTSHICAGVYGAIIGVSDIEKAELFYRNILQNSSVVKSTQSINTDYNILLKKERSETGAFANLLGGFEIELVQSSKPTQKLFENRYWGDLGFIHLCLDVVDMNAFKESQLKYGNSFSIDSEGFFEMDKAGGRFCYIEDADNTLIELVETYKVPILKKWGWFLSLKNRKTKRPLPNWMVKTLGLNKIPPDFNKQN